MMKHDQPELALRLSTQTIRQISRQTLVAAAGGDITQGPGPASGCRSCGTQGACGTTTLNLQ
jgi:hypothetical protein